ncbi:hypothetical protein JWV37_11135 [Sulfurospirillum sp. T05]|uniref:Uncharacterized protein n=1 Tax=Sulfurospirillum tamanense TaxID=2813362 RepID=A0ABS2WUJ6_9BACT|nr:hypothetical protein [Sulfurospirillum tamanensis]MBN2965336.1 hypothetical protein [Sulfurospirillum tamanensis]
MNNHELTWYMQEISMHALGAEIDFKNFLEAVNNEETRQTRTVWFHLTSFLSHAAMISKLVSPISPRDVKAERMNLLQEALNIESNSEVLPRNARDNVEHFDERIDNWVGTDSSTLLEVVLQNRTGYDFMNVDAKRVKRLLLLDELIFISETRNTDKFELKLQPLFNEVKRIGDEAGAWIERNSPYNFIYPQQGS